MSQSSLRRTVHLLTLVVLVLSLGSPVVGEFAAARAADRVAGPPAADLSLADAASRTGQPTGDVSQLLPIPLPTIPIVSTIVAPVATLIPPIIPTIPIVNTVVAPIATLVPPIPTIPIVNTIVAPIPTIIAPINTVVAPVRTVVAPLPTVVAPINTVVAPINTIVAPIPTIIAPGPTQTPRPPTPGTRPTATPTTPRTPTPGATATRASGTSASARASASAGDAGIDIDLNIDALGLGAVPLDGIIDLIGGDGNVSSAPLVVVKVDATTRAPLAGACFDRISIVPSVDGTVNALVRDVLDADATVLTEDLCSDARGEIAVGNPLQGLIDSIDVLPLTREATADLLQNIVVTVSANEITAPDGYLATGNVVAALSLAQIVGGRGIALDNQPDPDAGASGSAGASGAASGAASASVPVASGSGPASGAASGSAAPSAGGSVPASGSASGAASASGSGGASPSSSGAASASPSGGAVPSGPPGAPIGDVPLVIVKVDASTGDALRDVCFSGFNVVPSLSADIDQTLLALVNLGAVVDTRDLCTDASGRISLDTPLGGLIQSLNNRLLPSAVRDLLIDSIVVTVSATETVTPEGYVVEGTVVGAVNLRDLIDGGGVTFTNTQAPAEPGTPASASDGSNPASASASVDASGPVSGSPAASGSASGSVNGSASASASVSATGSASGPSSASASASPSGDPTPLPGSADLIIVKVDAETGTRLENACFQGISIVPELTGVVALPLDLGGLGANVTQTFCTDANGEIRVPNPLPNLLASVSGASLFGLTPRELARNISLTITLTEIGAPAGYLLPVDATTQVALNLAELVGGQGIEIQNQADPGATASDPGRGTPSGGASASTGGPADGSASPSGSASGPASGSASSSASSGAAASASVSPSGSASSSPLPSGPVPGAADLVVVKIDAQTRLPIQQVVCFQGGTIVPSLIDANLNPLGLASLLATVDLDGVLCTDASGTLRIPNPLPDLLAGLNLLDLSPLGLSPAQLARNIQLTVTLNEPTPPAGFVVPANARVSATINLATLLGGGGIEVANDRDPNASPPASVSPPASASTSAIGSPSASTSASGRGSIGPSPSASPSVSASGSASVSGSPSAGGSAGASGSASASPSGSTPASPSGSGSVGPSGSASASERASGGPSVSESPSASASASASASPGTVGGPATLRITVRSEVTDAVVTGSCFEADPAAAPNDSGACDAGGAPPAGVNVQAVRGDGVTVIPNLPVGAAEVTATFTPSPYAAPGPVTITLLPGVNDVEILIRTQGATSPSGPASASGVPSTSDLASGSGVASAPDGASASASASGGGSARPSDPVNAPAPAPVGGVNDSDSNGTGGPSASPGAPVVGLPDTGSGSGGGMDFTLLLAGLAVLLVIAVALGLRRPALLRAVGRRTR